MVQPQLEIKKMKQGMSYTCKEKTIILNVFKYFCTQFPDKCVTELVRRTAKATGCSEKSVFQFRKEEASGEGFKEPSKTKVRKCVNMNSRDIKYDNTVRQAIRHIIYDLKYKNIVPSLNNILKQVNADTQLPNFSLMTLRRLLCDMGFYYEKNGNKSVLMEKPDSRPTTNKLIYNKETTTTQNQNMNHNIPQMNIQPNNSTICTKKLNDVCHINKNNTNKEMKLENQNLNHINVNNHDVNDKLLHTSHVPPVNVQPNHMHLASVNDTQGYRLMPMHLSSVENHMVAPMHAPPHGMSMMINPRRDFMPSHSMPPPNIDLSVKREIPPWMYPSSNNMVKQQ